MSTLRQLHERLREDVWRKEAANAFSPEVKAVHDVLFYPFSDAKAKETAMSKWLQRFQPCMFGRIAAGKDWIHYCLITKEDILQKSDAEISELIHREWLAWQRRSLRPTSDFSEPAHGFLLYVVSDKVALAAPDDNLKAFSEKVRELLGSHGSESPQGTIHWETLCLWHPTANTYTKFTFGVDYFAAQGDGRWWEDHRIPGGIAFTANSVGHMRRYREWYSGLSGQEEWILKTAMETIHSASPTAHGKATWLKPIGKDGLPFVKDQKCPFSSPEKLKPSIRDKDWMRYGGFLHTDHSIREEFFHNEAEKIQEIAEQEYLEDFTYLYDPRMQDHTLFVAGEIVSEEKVFSDIGDLSAWVSIRRSKRQADPGDEEESGVMMQGEEANISSDDTDNSPGREELKRLLAICDSWTLRPEELAELLEIVAPPSA